MRETSKDESQNVLSTQKLFKTRDLELPNFLGSLPSCSPHSAGHTRTSVHPYFPVANGYVGPFSGVRQGWFWQMFLCTEFPPKILFPAVLPWQKKAMIFDIPEPPKPEQGTSPKAPFFQNRPFVSSRLLPKHSTITAVKVNFCDNGIPRKVQTERHQ